MKASIYCPIGFALIGLFAFGCSAAASDPADDPSLASQDAELLAGNADQAEVAGTDTESGSGNSRPVGQAAAPACTATSDGGKWCCAPDATGQLKCWKVPPAPPPDTIATRAVLTAKVLSP